MLTAGVNYLGFSNGGFDTIRLRDTTTGAGGTVTDGSFQALTIDNIETIPEPSLLMLLGISVAGLLARRKRRN